MAPKLAKFLKLEPNRSALLKSFTTLDISDGSHGCSTINHAMMCWPLRHLDLSVLQNLQLNGGEIFDGVLSILNDLFAGGSFFNIIKLSFTKVSINKTLTLTKMPSL